MTLIDETTPVNTTWEADDCAKNDLGYLLDHLANILTDHNGNRLLAHTGVMQCIDNQVWYQEI